MREPIAAGADDRERAVGRRRVRRDHRQPVAGGADARRIQQLDQPGDAVARVARELRHLRREGARPGDVEGALSVGHGRNSARIPPAWPEPTSRTRCARTSRS